MKKILFLLFLCVSLSAQEIQRLEPAVWWTGMHNPGLQVLVYGKNISETRVSLNHPGVKLLKVHKAESPNYLFLDLKIEKSAKAGNVKINFTSTGGKVISHALKLEARAAYSATRKSFDNSDVIYLITPDRFVNGDLNNDNTPDTKEKLNRSHYNGRHGGDIRGITDHLAYIKDMGFTTLWSMPLLENDLKQVTYHGYSITDYYKIDPRYGTNELFKEMVTRSNAMGLKWIMDVIPNHCGIDHWWMADLPFRDWINNDGKFRPANHRREVHQDIHASERDKENMKAGWFVPSMPDLNQRNPFMARYLTQNTIWWIEYAGLSGLRVDTWPYSEKGFLTQWMKDILAEYPNLNVVGEEWTTKANTIAYWQKGKSNPDGYETWIPSMMDFPLQTALVQALTEKEGFHNGLARLYQSLSDDYLYPDPDNLVVFADNHDMNRFFTQVKEDPHLFKMGLAFLATVRGIPQIYYGTEIGMANPDSEEHGVLRADMPGGWPGDQKNAFTGENLSPLQKELQDFTRRLFNWRKTATVVHRGKLIHFVPENGIYCYFRVDGQKKLWVIFNKNAEETVVKSSDYAEMISEEVRMTDVLDGSTWQKEVKVPARGFRILEI